MPKVDDKLQKPKPRKSLKINLNDNVTYTFDKMSSVNDLIDPEHLEKENVRRILAEEIKQKSIIKTSKNYK